jgi:hypothetical protein
MGNVNDSQMRQERADPDRVVRAATLDFGIDATFVSMIPGA